MIGCVTHERLERKSKVNPTFQSAQLYLQRISRYFGLLCCICAWSRRLRSLLETSITSSMCWNILSKFGGDGYKENITLYKNYIMFIKNVLNKKENNQLVYIF